MDDVSRDDGRRIYGCGGRATARGGEQEESKDGEEGWEGGVSVRRSKARGLGYLGRGGGSVDVCGHDMRCWRDLGSRDETAHHTTLVKGGVHHD
jgi:hypothetical protein